MNEVVKSLIERATSLFTGAASQVMSKSYKMWVHDGEFDFPGFAESERGCMMKCVNGKTYINMMGHLGAGILDADDRDVKRAIREQLDRGIVFSLPSTVEVELGELMREVVPNCESMRFCKNGSDATSAAIRIARSYKHRDHILMPRTGYHGWSDSFAAVGTRDYGIPEAFKPFIEFFDFNDTVLLEEKLSTGKFAAVIMEPVSIDEPKPGYLQQVRELCDQYDSLLIFDELVTGFRFALGGCQELYGVNADLMTFGKAMSNGTSIACVCGKREYMKELENVFFSATYFGECLSIAGSIATIKKLRKLKDKVYPHIWRQGNRLKRAFNRECKALGLDAEMVGMAPRLNAKFNHTDPGLIRDLWHQEMIKRGVFIGLQIYTTWAVKKKHMDQVIEAMKASLKVVAEAIQTGDPEEYLDGKRSEVIFKRQ